MDAARGHRVERRRDHRRASRRRGCARSARQQEVERHRLRELRRAAEAAEARRRTARATLRVRAASRIVGVEVAAASGAVASTCSSIASVSCSACSRDVVAPLAPRLGDRLAAPARTPACRGGRRSGSRCRRRTGRPSGVQPHAHRPAAAAGQRLHRLHVDRVDVGSLLAVDLHVDEQLVHQRGGRRRPRTTRAPSRGTSGTTSTRPTGRSACPRRARGANASSPHGYQSTGLSACWRRYGLVSSARRFGHASTRTRGVRVGGGRLGPAVVGLARRRAHDRVDEHDARAAPCSRRGARGVLLQRVERRRGARRAAARPRRPARPSARRARRRRPRRTTSACAFSTDSTSSGYTFSPPVLIDTEPRPSSVIVPSSSTTAWSPGTAQRTPSTTGNVAAVFSGSL